MLRLALCLALTSVLFAQRQRGELRLQATDPAGSAITAGIDLLSEINQVHRTGVADAAGRYTAQDLPFGLYRVRVSREGFQSVTRVVRITSEVPVELAITLGVAPIETRVDVTDSATILDPSRASALNSIGAQSIGEHQGAQPGRGLLDL